MNRLLLPATGLALLIAAPASALDAEQRAAIPSVADRTAATALTDIVVTANRSAQMIDRVGASVTILTQAAIETSQENTVAELVARTPGVNYARNGGIGTATSLFIRGAESYHTVALIDGVKMNDPSTTQGGSSFGSLLVGDTARIEVLRGPQSTLWGSQAIGGVINIVTAAPTETLQGSLSAEAGSRGTRAFRGGIGGTSDRLSWRLAANRYDTDGFSAYAPGAEDDGYSNTTLSGRVNYALTDDVSVDLRTVWIDSRSDIDGFGVDSREYADSEEIVTYAGLNFGLLDGRLQNRIGYAYTNTERSNFNPDRRIQTETFEAKGTNKRLDYQGIYAINDETSITFGYEGERAEMRTRSLSDSLKKPAFGTGHSDLDSTYAQLQWGLLPGLNLTAGVRHDEHQQYGTSTQGQAAAAWSLNQGKTVLKAGWGQGFRAPGLYELYSEYGNLSLSPETFDAWEVSIQQKLFDKATLIATYFAREADNEIRYNGCAYGTTDPLCTVDSTTRWGYYKNIQKTEAQGIELSGQVEVTPRFVVSTNYTWTEALNASGSNSGKRLTRRPAHMANMSADYGFQNGLKTGISVRYSGKSFNNDGNTSALDAYTLVDLRISYPVSDRLEVYGRIENLFDEQYQVVQDYGTADRGLFGGVRLRF